LAQNNFTLALSRLDEGFSASFSGSPGLSGFSLPTGSFEEVGAGPRTFNFDRNGMLVASAVPEPTTWAMMLIGFGAIGYSMRSACRKQKASVSYA
jgi:hypothetical protein